MQKIKKRKDRFIFWGIMGIIIYIFVGAILPFVYQPTISQDTVEDFDLDQFYGDDYISERASLLTDNGQALEERIRMISQAEEKIIISTFQFSSDYSGKVMLSSLLSAAKRGVKVQIIVDGLSGLMQLKGNKYFLALWEEDNAQIRIYNPISLFRPWSLNGRLHDKYLIADDSSYILGGRNIFDTFLGEDSSHKNHDWDLLVYNEGDGQSDSMKQLLAYFNTIWNKPESKDFKNNLGSLRKRAIEEAKDELETLYDKIQEEHAQWFEPIDYYEITKPVKSIRLQSNPTSAYAKEPIVFYTITRLMEEAKEDVKFHTPYIICNDWMLEKVEKVCKEVPNVSMMTNSVANNGNPFGAADYRKYKNDILDTGLEVMEYDGGTSYHGKCFVIDEDLLGVGSFNWDMRSTYIDTELMLIINSKELNKELRKEMEIYEKQALQVIDSEEYNTSEGLVPQTTSLVREIFLEIIGVFNIFFRFLM